jgi:hypothetical protein
MIVAATNVMVYTRVERANYHMNLKVNKIFCFTALYLGWHRSGQIGTTGEREKRRLGGRAKSSSIY